MTVSNKQISVVIISAFGIGLLVYYFLWFGYVEISINHSKITNFLVQTREKKYQCSQNPCRIKTRAGKKFLAQIDNKLVEEKIISVSKVPLWKTVKITVSTKKEIPVARLEKISRKNLYPTSTAFSSLENLHSFGPVLISQNEKFAVFSRYFGGKLKIFIKDKNSEQLLTTIKDEFQPIFLEKNFSLTSNGIIIPAKNKIYYYDFITQRKIKILEINSLRIANISVSADSQEVIFYNIKEKKWQKFNSKNGFVDLDNQKFNGFWRDRFLEIRGNYIYLNGQATWRIPIKLSPDNKIYLQDDEMIIEQDFEIWKVYL